MTLPEIIAEIGVNYYEIAARHSLGLVAAAQRMVAEAGAAGATVVKFQVYKAEKLAALDSPAYWDLSEEPTLSQRELFSKYDKLSIQDYQAIAAHCQAIGVEFLATAFDVENATEIDKLVSRHKIAAADITNIELLTYIGSRGKPVLLSTGASTREEIARALEVLAQAGAPRVTLLHCVLNYPTAVEKANLWKLGRLKAEFPAFPVGYSDHTKFNLDVLSTAWLLGAEVIEKHFTLDNTLKGNDHYHAATPGDLRALLDHLRILQGMVGQENPAWYDPAEEIARTYARRGVYLEKDVQGGDPPTADDVIFSRPQADGISPFEWMERLRRQEPYPGPMKKGQRIK